jgi:phosphopentomutase
MGKRAILLVLDSVGIGEMPDAGDFGDSGAHTLRHIAESVGGLQLPHLQSLGLGNISPIPGLASVAHPKASFGKCAEWAKGKDTTTGHWEMAGIKVHKPFPTFYEGFPEDFIKLFVERSKVPGVLGNFAASGTEIIQQLGEEHLKTGKPIVYTSADSVFQIACHETAFGLDRLYEICKVARSLCDELGVARVIARPFLGGRKGEFQRTKNRKDFSVALPEPSMADLILGEGKRETISVGKVASIYSDQGFSRLVKAGDNRAIYQSVLDEMARFQEGLLFANLVDFDMLYGHRRDPKGYAKELQWFDGELPKLLSALKPDDLLLMTADHGNDPTFPGSDHTREYIPLLAVNQGTLKGKGTDLGTRTTFADIGQTILEHLGCTSRQNMGQSFLSLIPIP